MRLLSVL